MNANVLEPQDQRGIDLAHADRHNAHLAGVDLSGACLVGADFTGADLHGANLTHADLADAVLNFANLNGANLTDADLSRTSLRGADLRGANLTRAWITGVSPYLIRSLAASGNRIDIRIELRRLRRGRLGADFTGAHYDSSTVWPEGFDTDGAGLILHR